MDTNLQKEKEVKITFFKQNKSTFISQRPCNHDGIEIIEAAGRAITWLFQIIAVLLFACLKYRYTL